MMRAEHRRLPFSISVDKNAAYPEAFSASQAERIVPKDCKLRRVKYLNNVIEQDHRFVKKKVRASQCFKSFHTAERTLEGIESVNMLRKGQVKRLDGRDAQGQAKFVESLFGVAAWRNILEELSRFKLIFATQPAQGQATFVASPFGSAAWQRVLEALVRLK
jgi:IS6 family transposase